MAEYSLLDLYDIARESGNACGKELLYRNHVFAVIAGHREVSIGYDADTSQCFDVSDMGARKFQQEVDKWINKEVK